MGGLERANANANTQTQAPAKTHPPTHNHPTTTNNTTAHLDVDPAREEVGGDEVAAGAVAEVVEDAVPVRLGHLRVDVEAGVAELGDLLLVWGGGWGGWGGV